MPRRATRTSRVETGLERILESPSKYLEKRERIGLIANPTAVTPDLAHAAPQLQTILGPRLKTLFGPEHGVFADAQDLVEVSDHRDSKTGLKVWSLYGNTRVPQEPMLRDLDTLIFDIQDVGSRYYTFIYTMLHAMEACASFGKRLVVLDRPNPIGGASVQGNVLDPQFRSFVGMHPLAVCHGMTVGELALMFRKELSLDVDLSVVPMHGWRRRMSYEETGLPWVMPSPNMPTVDTAVVYPGGCLIEGTNLSEGRGTTRPFHLVGAPWIDPWALASEMNRARLPGVAFRACYFTPTFQKHANALCGGVEVHVTDRARVDAFFTYLVLIQRAREQNKRKFQWRDPPYEYEFVKLPIDILCGGEDERRSIEAGRPWTTLRKDWSAECRAFELAREPYLLYS